MATKTTMTLEALAERVQRDLGDTLVAAVLYGSAARNERTDQRSDFNVLVIVRTLTPASLRALATTAAEWSASGNPAPLILTEDEWRSSRDIFAMEVADILERHRVLAGAMPAEPSRVAAADLRHQLEFEAMGKLLALRQGILASGGKAERELELLAASKSAVLVLFRTLLRIHGESGVAGPEDAVRRAAARAGFDPAPFLQVVAHVAGTARIPASQADAVLTAYHAGLERFVAHVDALPPVG
jgi:predicted nucleotidyltransferase